MPSNRIKTSLLAATFFALLNPAPVLADQPGAGLTAQFEIQFMQMTIDHHYAALRMTELAAGTDPTRDAGIDSNEGTAPTFGFGATQAKATLDDIKSLARRNNRMQREEMMTLKRFLREWYSIEYVPKVPASTQPMLALLEQAQPGADFNHKFLESFSRHHFTLSTPLNGCLAGTDLQHEDLRRECRSMWHSQMSDIDMMRHDLKRHFGISDYQPFSGTDPLQQNASVPRGQHSGND